MLKSAIEILQSKEQRDKGIQNNEWILREMNAPKYALWEYQKERKEQENI